ncbi:hypothetical protein [Cerasicoccus maritimus]|uniref:hypothetical protein n=1 Tax=Cerasicoccus maritimus TaxID=490089 RepID=UPI002852D2DD|nr:hypothetical protein [Cerasicoccus maritimus]
MSYTIPGAFESSIVEELLNPNHIELYLVVGSGVDYFEDPDLSEVVSLNFGTLDKLDVGSTISIGSEQPEWAAFNAALTDGSDGPLTALLVNSVDADGGYVTITNNEYTFLGGAAEMELNSISFTLSELAWEHGIYNVDGYEGSIERDYVTSFEGTFTPVPEPAVSAALMSAPLLMFVMWKKFQAKNRS